MVTLVTGAGLIGTAFARHAMKRGEHIVFLDPEPRQDFLRFKLGDSGYDLVRKDIRDLPGLIETIAAAKATTVVHTAGLIGGRVQKSLANAFSINLGGSNNIAEAVRLTGVRRLVQVSTFGVYDPFIQPTGPIGEDFPRGGKRGYGNLKGAIELMLEAYAAQYGFELVMLRPANVYGYGHFSAGSTGGMKMQALLEAGLFNTKATIASAQTMATEYVYEDDVGIAVELAATVAAPSRTTFNIGNGALTTFDELVAAVKAVAPGFQCEVEPGDAPQSKAYPLDISQAEKGLGWKPQYSLLDGFQAFKAEIARAGRL
ncbi:MULTISPECIES: NAD(P)-dependent oxidoreductase [unclassified Beijerinckia]|uniref:NAD-dependent epimerase/dehydratase family protein n=1 Tax=unclassified Beijerinckia TaxID=2638183 RepID=UPI000894C311|nr:MULTISPECIES: NAD(P)-dependent oxidoreductase [unclassified Beijerinckia]MDH7797535.1 nucleoside-diphosphate-sugar epimerase [Beijerinckia sp. GAS462]SEC89524.1 Nucleoside-diphosphate-sugar epimerase [Beijerinckia sp. 28-YEA-48]